MVVRRLELVHRCGFVHCDVQPANIIMAGNDIGIPNGSILPFLIDFGCAQPLDGGKELRADFGSVDFNSIRTAQGGTRGPFDDIESLGYVLCNLLFDRLPWFPYTKKAHWVHGKLSDDDRPLVCGAVSEAKAKFIDEAKPQLDDEWKELEQTPEELLKFLRLAHNRGIEGHASAAALDAQQVPDYRTFEEALGSTSRDAAAAEEMDKSALKVIVEHKAQADAERRGRLRAEREKSQAASATKKVVQTSTSPTTASVSGIPSPQHAAPQIRTAKERAATGNTVNDKQQEDKESAGADKQDQQKNVMEFLKRRSQRSDSSKDMGPDSDMLQATDGHEDITSNESNPIGCWFYNLGRSSYEISNIAELPGQYLLWFNQPMANGRRLQGQCVKIDESHIDFFADSSMSEWAWLVALANEGFVRLRRRGEEMESSYRKPGSKEWMLPKRSQKITSG